MSETAKWEPCEPHMSYFLGLFATDGCHDGDINAKGRMSIELASRDEDILLALHQLLPVKSTITRRTRTTNFAANYSSTTLSIFNQGFRRQVASIGYPPGPKSATCRHPYDEFDERHFTRGLIDGDGSVGVTAKGYPFVSFVTASEPMASYYEGVLGSDEFWIVRHTRRNKRDGAFNIMVAGENAVDVMSWLYQDGDIAIRRKAQVAEDIVANYQRTRHRRRWTPEDRRLVEQSATIQEASLLTGRTEVAVREQWRRLHPKTAA